MRRTVAVALLIHLLAFGMACEKSPARKELTQMNVKYSKHEFFKAVEQSNRVVLELFIAAGMKPDVRDKDYRTALMNAARDGHIDIVGLLVEHGADVNATSGDGGTALMDAAYKGHPDVVHFLVEHGSDINAKDKYGSTALSAAAAGLVHEEGQYAEVIRFLLEHGSDANAQPRDRWTALMRAAEKGDADLVRLLVEHGADVNAKGGLNRTALMWAVQKAPSEVVQYLLKHGADPNVEMEKVGGTALDIAEDMHRPDIVKMLKDAGAKKWVRPGTEGTTRKQ